MRKQSDLEVRISTTEKWACDAAKFRRVGEEVLEKRAGRRGGVKEGELRGYREILANSYKKGGLQKAS